MHSIKLSGYEDPLAVVQNNYTTKVVNALIVYVLDTWPNNPLRDFTLYNCLFVATSVLKNSDKDKWVYSDYGIAFDGKIHVGFDNSLSSHIDNHKNNFLMLSEGPTYCINKALVHQKNV